ncbi:Ku protein [Streptomyces sp. NPDC002055]|uniref:non-homologous end joining protein Ku n=1 Tax=Streptomyces sp. NPDC002055 TaxID=3154534 RepID=UPI0033294246
MRALWSGTIQFGLVALPVKLYSATEEQRVRLREVHAADAGRVRHRRVCEAEDREISWEEVGRGWELPDGRLVPLSEQDLERLPLPTRHVVEVLGFTPASAIDPITFSKPYYAGPAGADRPYALLAAGLERTGYAGVCKVAIRGRERLALLWPRRGVLVVQTLLWPAEVRDPGGLAPQVPVAETELRLAEVLMEEMLGVQLEELHDEYGRALEELVTAKLTGGELAGTPEPQPPVDLMVALEESVRRSRRHR